MGVYCGPAVSLGFDRTYISGWSPSSRRGGGGVDWEDSGSQSRWTGK